MARLTVGQTVSKWQANAGTLQALQYYKAGVASPRRDWAAATEAAEDAWKAGIAAAIQLGTRIAGVKAAGTSFWQKQTAAKSGNWQTGIANSTTKATAGFDRLYNYLSAGDQAVANMPRATRAERIARSQTYLNAVGAARDADKSRV